MHSFFQNQLCIDCFPPTVKGIFCAVCLCVQWASACWNPAVSLCRPTVQHPHSGNLETCWPAAHLFIFFPPLMCFPVKKIIVLLIKRLSCRKVNVIPAPDKATHRGLLALCLGALKPADKTALGEGFSKMIRAKKKEKKEEKRRRKWGKMDHQHPQPTGHHLWLLQATHTGTGRATGRLLIYLGLLSLRGRVSLEINATFFPYVC